MPGNRLDYLLPGVHKQSTSMKKTITNMSSGPIWELESLLDDSRGTSGAVHFRGSFFFILTSAFTVVHGSIILHRNLKSKKNFTFFEVAEFRELLEDKKREDIIFP